MRTLNYFWKQAINSSRRGKFYKRPWINLYRICMIEIKCLLLTGRTLDEIKN